MSAGGAVGAVVARGVTRPGAPGQIMMASSPTGAVRAAGGQIMVQASNLQRAVPGQLVMASGGQLRQGGVMVVTTAPTTPGSAAGGVIVQSTAASGATRQHYVISSSQAGGQAQIVALQPGQSVRPGQLVQVRRNKAATGKD